MAGAFPHQKKITEAILMVTSHVDDKNHDIFMVSKVTLSINHGPVVLAKSHFEPGRVSEYSWRWGDALQSRAYGADCPSRHRNDDFRRGPPAPGWQCAGQVHQGISSTAGRRRRPGNACWCPQRCQTKQPKAGAGRDCRSTTSDTPEVKGKPAGTADIVVSAC